MFEKYFTYCDVNAIPKIEKATALQILSKLEIGDNIRQSINEKKVTIRKNVRWTQDSDPQLTASLSEIARCMENYKDYLIIAKNENEIAYGLITGYTISRADILKKIIMAPNKPVKLEVLGKQVDVSSLGLFFPVSTHCDIKAVCEIEKD